MAKAVDDLVELRRDLHRFPEPSGSEAETAARIARELKARGIAVVATGLGGHGVLARVGPEGPGPMFRADLDALALREESGVAHASENAGHHHACGHDGHMVMLLGGLASMFGDKTVYGLFQPAEETGEGMARVLAELNVPITSVYAIHNVPGVARGTVLVRKGTAAVASSGLRLHLAGVQSHASEPENGRSPLPVLARAIDAFVAAPSAVGDKVAFVEASAGGPTYGTSAGAAMLGATLRADNDERLQAMQDGVTDAVREHAAAHGIECASEPVEPFPACMNDARAVECVFAAADAAGLAVESPERPFPWSEDFGHALARWPGALIGLGAGKEQPPLHHNTYDFPDDLIESGVRFWRALAEVA